MERFNVYNCVEVSRRVRAEGKRENDILPHARLNTYKTLSGVVSGVTLRVFQVYGSFAGARVIR